MASLQLYDQNPVLSIQKFGNFELDVAPVFKNTMVRENVTSLEERYRAINVDQCMKKLHTVGKLLSVAFAGSKGFKCNAQVMMLLADYQTLSKDSLMASIDFRMASMKALEYHSLAIKLVAKQKPEKAFQVLALTSKVADKMAGIASGLVGKSEHMVELAKNALVAASTDNSIAVEDRKKIEAMMAELNIHKVELELTTGSLKAQVIDVVAEERKAEKKADEARNTALVLAIVGTLADGYANVQRKEATANIGRIKQPQTPDQNEKKAVPPPEIARMASMASKIATKKGDLAEAESAFQDEVDAEKKAALKNRIAGLQYEIASLEKEHKAILDAFNSMRDQKIMEANSADEREARLHAERVHLQDLERKANAELAGAVEKLKSMAAQHDTLGQALASLDMAIKALGQIKTVFENTRVYWDSVKKHCEDLANIDTMEFLQDLEDEFVDAITKSWYSWLVLGKINNAAVHAMEGVMAEVDRTMDDLPTTKEAQDRLADMIMLMDADLQQERMQLDAVPIAKAPKAE